MMGWWRNGPFVVELDVKLLRLCILFVVVELCTCLWIVMYETIRPSTFISVMLRGWFVKLVTLSYGYTHALLLIITVKCYIFGKSHVNFFNFIEPSSRLASFTEPACRASSLAYKA